MDKILSRLKIRRGVSATESHLIKNSPQTSSSTPCTSISLGLTTDTNTGEEEDNALQIRVQNDECIETEHEDASSLPRLMGGLQLDGENSTQQQLTLNLQQSHITCTDKNYNHTENLNRAVLGNLDSTVTEVIDSSNNTLAEADTISHLLMSKEDLIKKEILQKDISLFCEQLRHILDYIQSSEELKNLTYKYPSHQQHILEKQANELHSLYMEVRAAKLNVQRVKNQRKAVRKECNAVLKSLTKIKEEEVKEMENFVSLYDKTLLARWEKIRDSTEEEMVESFLHDLQGKQQALNHLQTLASHKLKQIKSGSQANTVDETKPASVAVRRLSVNGSGRNSAARWRSKHSDRTVRNSTCSANQGSNNLSLVPTTSGTAHLQTQPTRNGGSTNVSRVITGAPGSGISSAQESSTISISTGSGGHNSPDHKPILQDLLSNLQHSETHDNLPINAVIPEIIASTSGLMTIQMTSNRATRNQQRSDISSEYSDIELYSIPDQR